MGSHSSVIPRLLLVAAAVLFSTGGAAIKATSLASWQVASFRSGVAAITLAALAPGARRGWNWRVWPAGVAYATTLVLFVVANKLTTGANAIFLQSTAPLYLLLLSPLLLGERVRLAELLLVVPIAAGMAMFFVGSESPLATAPDPVRGNIAGAITGLSWAFTVTALRRLGRNPERGDSSLPTVIAGNVIAFAAALPMAFPLSRITPTDAVTLIYLGVFQIGLAYFCVTRALRHVTAFEAALLLMLEPVLNPVWTWLVHGEQPSGWSLAGGALILGATLGNTWLRSRSARIEHAVAADD